MQEAKFAVVQGGKIQPDEELEELVAEIWGDVVKHIKDVLNGDSHGYESFLELADPSIDQIVESITKVDELMNKMLDGAVAGDLPIDVELRLIDCQQCIHLIRRVHVALKHDDQGEYEDVIRKLKRHQSA